MSLLLTSNEIKSLLIPPEHRTSEDILNIYELTKPFGSLTGVVKDNDKLHKACCKLMTFEEFSPGETVMLYGDIADKFYIVLSGALSVLVPLIDDNLSVYNMKEVKIMRKGEYFGELALIRGTNRAATVIAKEASLLAVLRKNDFKKTFEELMSKKINEKVEFLKKIPLFGGLSGLELQKLSYFFNEAKFTKNQYLYKEGLPVSHVFFVKSGDFKLIKTGEFVKNTGNFLLKDRKSNQRLQLKKKPDLAIVIKGQNECLGYEDSLKEYPVYKYSCQCSSFIGDCLSISLSDFKQRIRFPQSLKFLNEKNSFDKNMYSERMLKLKKAENIKELFSKNKGNPAISISLTTIALQKFSLVRDLCKSTYVISEERSNTSLFNSPMVSQKYQSFKNLAPLGTSQNISTTSLNKRKYGLTARSKIE